MGKLNDARVCDISFTSEQVKGNSEGNQGVDSDSNRESYDEHPLYMSTVGHPVSIDGTGQQVR